MHPKIIVAYDGAPHSQDAIALARLLARVTGIPLALAHVYRALGEGSPSQRPPEGRQEFLRHHGEALLERGAAGLDEPQVERHAVAATTTAMGLRELAEREHAAVIVFGSAQNGPAGHAHPGSAARRLLQMSPAAVAVAPAGFAERAPAQIDTIAVAHDDPDGGARSTAEALAARTGARLVDDGADLVLVGSRPGAEPGRVMTSASGEQQIQSSTAPVLVVPRGAGALRAPEPALV